MRRPLAVLAALLGAACGLGIHEPTGPCGEDAHPGPTPQQLAFVSDALYGQYDICLINVDGTAVAQLTTSLGSDLWPAWNPGGTRLAFQSYRTLTPGGGLPQSDIFVINVDGTGETQLTADTTNEAQPAWSPDGTKIAFVTDRDGNNEVYVMDADGQNVRRLTNNAAADEQPAWSPSGARIAFVSDRTGNPDIFVMDSTGANPVQLTNNPAVDVGPAWSPDSLKIAFHSDRPGKFALFIMNADGTGQWSPDGTHLVFDTDGELWVIRPDGSEPRQVTHSKYVQDFMARWRP